MDDGATLDDARRVLARIGRERGKTTVIAVTRLVRRIIGAVEVSAVRTPARRSARARRRLGRRRGPAAHEGKTTERAMTAREHRAKAAMTYAGPGRTRRARGQSIDRSARAACGAGPDARAGARTSRDSVDALTHRHRVRARARRARCGSTRRTTRRRSPCRWCLREERRASSERSVARLATRARIALSSARARVVFPRRADTAHRNTALESSRSLASPARACGRASRSRARFRFLLIGLRSARAVTRRASISSRRRRRRARSTRG